MKNLLTLLLALFLLQSCGNGTEKQTTETTTDTVAKDSILKVVPLVKNNDFSFRVEGDYISDDTDCKIKLTLFYDNGQLKYKMQTDTRTLSDNAEISQEDDTYYITFKNIEWSEYKGAIELDENGDEIDNDLGLPEDIQGVLNADEITIQNEGNAMNYYVKLGECGVKYIHLVRQKIN